MKMRLEKPEIAKRAGEEGKIYSFGKEIWRFILVFLIGSFIAGLLPAIYEMYLFLSNVEMFDQLQRLFLNDDSSFSDMMELATDMTDGMYILTLFCTLILIISVLVYCNKIEKRSYYSMGIVKKDGAKHYVQGLLVGAVSFSLCVLAGAALGFVELQSADRTFIFYRISGTGLQRGDCIPRVFYDKPDETKLGGKSCSCEFAGICILPYVESGTYDSGIHQPAVDRNIPVTVCDKNK